MITDQSRNWTRLSGSDQLIVKFPEFRLNEFLDWIFLPDSDYVGSYMVLLADLVYGYLAWFTIHALCTCVLLFNDMTE